MKEYIEENELYVFDKKKWNLIKKIFDIVDNNNTVTVVIFSNWTVKVEGPDCKLKKDVVKIFYKHEITADKHYDMFNMYQEKK